MTERSATKQQYSVRPVGIFLMVLGLLACLPVLLQVGRYALARSTGEPLQAVVTHTWLTHSTSTSFTFFRNGRSHSTPQHQVNVEFAVLSADAVPTERVPAPDLPRTRPSSADERAQEAVNAIMAKVRAKPMAPPASAPRFVRNDLPAELSAALYPGKTLVAKRSGASLLLEDEYAHTLPPHLLPLLALGAGLLTLGGLLCALTRRPRKAPITMLANSPCTPPAQADTRLSALKISHVERWEQFNEYEGHCIAQWEGREDCFYLMRVGDEWDALKCGDEWLARVEFECSSPLEFFADGHGLAPALTQIQGVNYRICGEVLRQEGELVWLDLPWPIVVDLDSSRPQERPITPGCWLRANGVLQARAPDDC